MTEDTIAIENLLSKLPSGTTDDRFDALMSLPREFRQSPVVKTESHQSTERDPKLEESKEPQSKEEPKKRGFFKRMFG